VSRPQVLRVLFLEDEPDDVILVRRELEQGGFTVETERVENRTELARALESGEWDLVLADYNLPGFSANEAVRMVRDAGGETPVILISGSIEEEMAVSAMRAGYHDFISKGRLARLVPAVERELREATERRKHAAVRRELRASETRFRELAEYIDDAFWISTPDKSRMLYVSPAFKEIWGIAPDILYEDPLRWLESVEPEDREGVDAVLPKQARERCEFQYRIRRPDGEVRWIWDRSFPIRNGEGEVVRVVGVAEDITNRITLEEQFLHSQKMEAVGRLAGGVAHDFNNLLTVIGGRTELLLADVPEGSPLREDLDEIRRAATQAASLTRRLLAFSKRQILQPRQIRVESVVGEMERMLQGLVGDSLGLEVELSDAPGFIRADPGQLEQVILNLVVNAREAIQGHGTIRIRTGRGTEGPGTPNPGRETITLQVSDDGEGIPDEVKRRIFEPFFTTKDEGTGLGLSTVFGIVDQAHGRVDVVSEVGRGTTFTIHFPAES
jgi:two-component system, cell cycle sensor histidine kinase and response regulator CckA